MLNQVMEERTNETAIAPTGTTGTGGGKGIFDSTADMVSKEPKVVHLADV